MLRRVNFRKAILAGAAGALAWDFAARVLIGLGLPLFDITRTLGAAFLPSAWWPIGLLLHAGVGVIWAVFYCYFFWSTLPFPPAAQGLAFAVLPTLLAGFVMVPQLGVMSPAILSGREPFPGVFGLNMGWGGPVAVVLGHAVYGLVMGAIYTRPVGYRVRSAASAT